MLAASAHHAQVILIFYVMHPDDENNTLYKISQRRRVTFLREFCFREYTYGLVYEMHSGTLMFPIGA